MAGERFAVRNSGARAVVEGTGDHGCEYMTGGVVVVLGRTGRNFAAGMSGGVAFVLNETENFEQRCNMGMVELEKVRDEEDKQLLRTTDRIPFQVYRQPQGQAGAWMRWNAMVPKFVKIMPIDYKRVLAERKAAASKNERKRIGGPWLIPRAS